MSSLRWRKFLSKIRASLHLLLFYICFRSLLINTRLLFFSLFVSVPLRKGYRGLEYKFSFVRLYLFLFAFLIICIETFGFHRLFCNICDYRSFAGKPDQLIHVVAAPLNKKTWREDLFLNLMLLLSLNLTLPPSAFQKDILK